MCEGSCGIAIVAKPYNPAIKNNKNWVVNKDGLAAIARRNASDSPPLNLINKGEGLVAASWGPITVISVYISPNINKREFDERLRVLERQIVKHSTGPLVVAGDFNAKNVAWGSPHTDWRGGEVYEWAAQNRLIHGWRVKTEKETDSDHRYITFSVSTLSKEVLERRLLREASSRRWALRKIDEDAIVAALIVGSAPNEGVEERRAWLQNIITQACDVAMPRARNRPRKEAYWWLEDLAELRRSCDHARRRVQRRKRYVLLDPEGLEDAWDAYKKTRNALRVSIKQAKARAWEELLSSLDRDPWGRPYRMVLNKLKRGTAPLTETMDLHLVEEVIDTLFPRIDGDHRIEKREQEWNEEEMRVTRGELRDAVRKIKRGKALGPDGVHGKVWALAFKDLAEPMKHLYNECLKTGSFPQVWKKANIVLLPKEGKPRESPLAYRPICLLDKAGKILERIIADRLVYHLYWNGPQLNDKQYGFRAGRSTVDAILRVRSVSRAVGSVLGPLMWNLAYDVTLRTALPPGCNVICYADDTLVMVGGDIWGEAVARANIAVARVVYTIEEVGLKVAPQKTEAVFFHDGSHGAPPKVQILVGNTPVKVGTQIKYLGLHLDGKWAFGEHFRQLTPRVNEAAMALCRLLPNLGGPDGRVRRLYAGTVYSMIMYGAPVWAEKVGTTRRLKDALYQLQRRVANRICRGFRTVSWTAVGVLFGVLPIELLVRMYTEVYRRTRGLQRERMAVTDSIRRALRTQTRRQLIESWSGGLQDPRLPGQWTVGVIRPCLEQWLGRAKGGVLYRMTQVLTGHGCFGEYLCRIKKERTTRCHHCGFERDTAGHTLQECVAWADEREELVATIGRDPALPAIVKAIVAEEEAWKAFSSFCESVLLQKEEAERERERAGRGNSQPSEEEDEGEDTENGDRPPLFPPSANLLSV
ncbi:uncharacterized protein LOC114929629 [Nylanderia fulva]|uniref:uncharacterized protein LOC114929629 n=1 Tax=Nylanderia fulva TaxID=613905 RepID=UPI0010FB8EB2|nr:uncharacterized protein LOC114929629 [Nylanderia fulva]